MRQIADITTNEKGNVMSANTNVKTLKTILMMDAATCLVFGLLLCLGTVPLAGWLGFPTDLLFYAGLILFPCAALMYLTGKQAQPNRHLVWLIIVGNVGWVVASFGLLALPSINPTMLGNAFVVVQAIAVIILAGIEYRQLATTAKIITA